jgi:serine/threonine protein kinase
LGDDADSRLKAREGSVLDGKWTLERLLGSGGMAAVYLARHRNGARAAVKILHPDLARNEEVRERFLREGYAANQVEHPGAVQVLDDDVVADGPDKGTAYLVMEVLEGESLQDRLERGPPMGEVEFLRVAESVLEVLDAAHARGVVHRDLKPENLFLVGATSAAQALRVKILDFGLARLLQNQTITTYGLALGTPSFMSPEQASGRIDDIDGRTDLFALAATGFRLRAGRRIHEADNPVDLVMKMAKVPAPRLATVAPGVSEPFARVIDRGLEFQREDRYETAAAMIKDVRRAIKQLEAAIPRATKKRKEPSAATIELSDSDLLVPQREPWPTVDESVRIPKNRSLLPWLLLLALAGVGGKLWGRQTWAIARARWAAPSAATASSTAAAQDAPPVASTQADAGVAATAAAPAASAQADGGVAATAMQSDAPQGPHVTRSDRKAGAVGGQPASPHSAPILPHRAPARRSPAQIVKTKKHRA